MKEQKKKRLIAILLFISCFISGYMLFTTTGGESKQLRNLAQVDSLVYKKLSSFNISEQQVKVTKTRVDSNFNRKTYLVGLPYHFSKTQIHAELNGTFHAYSVETPARVTFPEKNVDIHLTYRGTVIRTISLQTDPDLTVSRNPLSILIAFDGVPDDDLINELANLGESIPLVIKIENALQADEINKRIGDQFENILFWLKNEDGQDMLNSDPGSAIATLTQLEDIQPGATVLQFQYEEQMLQQLVAKTDLAFIDASNALLLPKKMEKTSFSEELHEVYTNPAYSIAVIKGNKTTFSWLKEELPELKKAGVDLLLPPKLTF